MARGRVSPGTDRPEKLARGRIYVDTYTQGERERERETRRTVPEERLFSRFLFPRLLLLLRLEGKALFCQAGKRNTRQSRAAYK